MVLLAQAMLYNEKGSIGSSCVSIYGPIARIQVDSSQDDVCVVQIVKRLILQEQNSALNAGSAYLLARIAARSILPMPNFVSNVGRGSSRWGRVTGDHPIIKDNLGGTMAVPARGGKTRQMAS